MQRAAQDRARSMACS